MAVRVLFGNNKGGSGKTGACINVAGALADMGHRVLVVDIDPQANASRRLGVPFQREYPTPTIAEAIKDAGEGVAASAIVPCQWGGNYSERISVIPSRYDLENRVSEAGIVGAVSRLRRAMSGVDDEYDYTFFDCPPSLGHLTQLGLAASNYVLCTVDPEYDGVDGGVRLRDFIANHAADLGNPQLKLLGVIVSRYRQQLGSHAFQVEGMPEVFGAELIWEEIVPERAPVKDAADAASSLRQVASTSAREMMAVYAKIAERIVKEAV